MLERIAERSFNCISVDGDTSTNDSLILAATGAGASPVDRARRAQAGSGDHRRGAPSRAGDRARRRGSDQVRHRARRARPQPRRMPQGRLCHRAFAAETAFFASTPISGASSRAIGNTGVDLGKLSLYLDEFPVATGAGRHGSYREEQGAAAMRKPEITVRAVLNRGSGWPPFGLAISPTTT